MSNDKKTKPIWRGAVAAPFGRFSQHNRGRSPYNNVLVGREEQRSQLLDLLINAGSRVALLVTGRRGVGKTVFVNHCLREYEQLPYQRFLRSRTGRSPADFLWIVLLALMIATMLLVVSEAMALMLTVVDSSHTLVVPVMGLVLISLAPVLYATMIINRLFKSEGSSAVWNTVGALLALASILVPSIIYLSNAEGLSNSNGLRLEQFSAWMSTSQTAILLAAYCILPAVLRRVDRVWGLHGHGGQMGLAVMLCASCYGLAWLFWDEGVVTAIIVLGALGILPGLARLWVDCRSHFGHAFGVTLLIALMFSSLLLVLGFTAFKAPTDWTNILLTCLFGVLLYGITIFGKGRPALRARVYPVRTLTWLKVFVIATIAGELLAPFFVYLATSIGMVETREISLSIFSGEVEETWWLFSTVLLILVIAWVEFEWIIRPFADVRFGALGERSVGVPPFEDPEGLHRLHLEQSLLDMREYGRLLRRLARARGHTIDMQQLCIFGTKSGLGAWIVSGALSDDCPAIHARPMPSFVKWFTDDPGLLKKLQAVAKESGITVPDHTVIRGTSESAEYEELTYLEALEALAAWREQLLLPSHLSSPDDLWRWFNDANAGISAIAKGRFVSQPASRFFWRDEQMREDLIREVLKERLYFDSRTGQDFGRTQREHRDISILTLPNLCFSLWMPTMQVSVNLGFDDLEYRHVTQSMLVNLRASLHKALLSWNSPLTFVGRGLTVILVLWLLGNASTFYFKIPKLAEGTEARYISDTDLSMEGVLNDFLGRANEGAQVSNQAVTKTIDYCGILQNGTIAEDRPDDGLAPKSALRETGAAIRMLCQISHSSASWMMSILYLDILSIPLGEHEDFAINRKASHPKAEIDDQQNSTNAIRQSVIGTSAEDISASITKDKAADKNKTPVQGVRYLPVDEQALIYRFFHRNWNLPEFGAVAEGAMPPSVQRESASFRIHHLISLAIIWYLITWVTRRLPILPFRGVMQQIDQLLEELRGRRLEVSATQGPRPWQWLTNMIFGQRATHTETDRVEPRSVELGVLEILAKLRSSDIAFLKLFGLRLSAPTPEIIFTFDELDKLTGNPAREDATKVRRETQDHLEKERAAAMASLFSDMKRIISSADAKFIFIGSRLLYDEWMADRTLRQPLFSSIFEDNIYIPSLLTDHSLEWMRGAPSEQRAVGDVRPPGALMHSRTVEYLLHQLRHAVFRNREWQRRTVAPMTELGSDGHYPPQFTQVRFKPRQKQMQAAARALRFIRTEDGTPLSPRHEQMRYSSLVEFLSYRSAGNPKQLGDLLSQMIVSAPRALAPEALTREYRNMRFEDVIYLSDAEQFRLQLIGEIYRNLSWGFRSKIEMRDDNIPVALFFLTDFLLKFHGRAFSWTSLERIEELTHLHRAPDMRELQAQLVHHASERMLHPVLNGMYAYRFQSEFAREIQFVSHISLDEQAAFNFTQDESKALKATFEAMLHREKRSNPDVISALGELHEYDQEFEMARQRYWHAMTIADRQFMHTVGKRIPINSSEPTKTKAKSGGKKARRESEHFLTAVLSGNEDGVRATRYFVPWGVTRVRLLLQVGMTYERASNYEQALARYQQAQTLSIRLLKAYLPAWWEYGKEKDEDAYDPGMYPDMHHLPKHFTVLYQGVFATAWLMEKMREGLDTSVRLIERDLRMLRQNLPFYGDMQALAQLEMDAPIIEDAQEAGPDLTKKSGKSKNKAETKRLKQEKENAKRRERILQHSTNSIIGAQLHNKSGDIYFFRGRQYVPVSRIRELVDADDQDTHIVQGYEGNLLKGHEHYALSLHELRRAITHRRLISPEIMNVTFPENADGQKPWPTVAPEGWSVYARQTAGNGLADFAECLLGRISFFGVVRQVCTEGMGAMSIDEIRGHSILNGRGRMASVDTLTRKENCITAAIEKWLDRRDHDPEIPLFMRADHDGKSSARYVYLGETSNWLGKWTEKAELPEAPAGILEFTGGDKSLTRLHVALQMMIAASEMYERSGAYDAAAQERRRVATVIEKYLWSMLSMHAMPSLPDGLQVPFESLCKSQTVQYLMRLAVRQVEEADRLFITRTGGRLHDGTTVEQNYLLGETIPIGLHTLSCSLLMVGAMLYGAYDKDDDEDKRQNWNRDILVSLLLKWLKPEPQYDDGLALSVEEEKALVDLQAAKLSAVGLSDAARHLLRGAVDRHRFPVLGALNGMRRLVDRRCLLHLLRPEPEQKLEDFNDVVDLANLMTETYDRYDSRQHFTPFDLAQTNANLYFARQRILGEEGDKVDALQNRLRRRARADFADARQMVTLGESYYREIKPLYYLYDDFNDRTIHNNRAMMMAMIEVMAVMRKALPHDGKRWNSEARNLE